MFSGVFLHIILGSIGNHSYMQRQTGAAWGQVCAEITTLGIEWAIVDNSVKTSMKLTRLHSIIKWLRSLSIGLLTVCVLWLSAWACERARVRQKSGWKSKTCLHMLDIIRQLLALCLFVRSLPPPQHFQLHGPQTGPLIPSRFFPLRCVDFCSFFLHIRSPTLAAAKEMISCRTPSPPFPFDLCINTHISAIDVTCLHSIWSRRAYLLTVRQTGQWCFFYEPETSSKHKDCGVSREAP